MRLTKKEIYVTSLEEKLSFLEGSSEGAKLVMNNFEAGFSTSGDQEFIKKFYLIAAKSFIEDFFEMNKIKMQLTEWKI